MPAGARTPRANWYMALDVKRWPQRSQRRQAASNHFPY